MKKELHQQFLTGERALFQGKDLMIYDSTFAGGESPLKESSNIELYNSMFKWKYPLWYSKNILVRDCTLFDTARAGIWYTENIDIADSVIEAPKTFRRSRGIRLTNVFLPNALETLWNCEEVEMNHVNLKGDYIAMNSKRVSLDNVKLVGNYCFDGAKDITVTNSTLLSKDSFWNSENVMVRDSFISGEYLGWNSKNLTLENCTVESLQGFCYIDNLVMKNCKLVNTTLAFEFSTVDVDISNTIDSVMNPNGGIIRAEHIEELILEKDKIDPGKTKIICRE